MKMNLLFSFTALIVCRIVIVVGSINCDFDRSQCGYVTIRRSEGIRWERNRIRDARAFWVVGPRVDHTTSTDRGGVMFAREIVISNSRSAKLASPVQTRPLCFIYFSYYMNHASLLRLTVSIIEPNGRQRAQLTVIRGIAGDQWHEVKHSVQGTTNGEWKLEFEAFATTGPIDGRKTYFLDDIRGDACNCTSSYCFNGGTCRETEEGAICQCTPGFTGNTCQTNIDECSTHPCENGGTCQSGINDFTCQCVPGFTGDRCQSNIDECSQTPCGNGGTCQDGINGFSCQCIPGFTGNRCQTNINECSPNPCRNGGACHDEVNGVSCSCNLEYTGSRCDVIIEHVSSPHTTANPHSSGADKLCLVCQRLQHPEQCTTFVKTWPHEACETQHIALPNGTLIFNLGFTNNRNCEGGGHRERRQALGDGVMLCHKCCDTDLCNHKLCTSSSTNATRLACITGETTGLSGHTSVRLCEPGQLCYTDRPRHGRPGQLRYDCVSRAFCNQTIAANSHPENCRVCCNTDGCNAHECGIF